MTPRVYPLALTKVTIAVVAWGASFVATKQALADAQPATVVWLRFAMGVAILGLAVAARRQLAPPPARELGLLALLGFLGVAFHQWLQANGLVTAQATTSAWIVATTPIFAALLGRLVLGERLGGWRALGIPLAAAGVLIVVARGDLAALAAGQFGTPGDLLVLFSAPNWAVFTVLSRHSLARFAPAQLMLYVMSLGWLFVTPWFLVAAGPGDLARLTTGGWLAVGFLGVFCSGLAYIFWYDALQVIPAGRLSAFLYVEPLVTVAVAAALGREAVLASTLLGGAAIVAGVWLVNRPAARPAAAAAVASEPPT